MCRKDSSVGGEDVSVTARSSLVWPLSRVCPLVRSHNGRFEHESTAAPNRMLLAWHDDLHLSIHITNDNRVRCCGRVLVDALYCIEFL